MQLQTSVRLFEKRILLLLGSLCLRRIVFTGIVNEVKKKRFLQIVFIFNSLLFQLYKNRE